jgi:hypothetical protein
MILGRPTLIAPVVATVLVHAILTAYYVRKHHSDPSSLVCVGENRAGEPPYEEVTYHIAAWSNGYDGQFYYVIARAPWRRQPQGLHGVDWCGPRQLRIMYPAICWIFSGGDARLLFWIMPAVNVAALGGLAAVGAYLARRSSLSVWWGFVLPFAINAGMPVLRDLTEPMAMLGVFGLLAGWLLRSPWWVFALWGSVAVLSREQNVVLVGLTVIGAVATWRWRIAAGLAAVLAVWLAWVGYLRGLYGDWPFLPSEGNLGFPFNGMLHRWTHLGGDPGGSRRMELIQAVTMMQLTVEIAAGLYLAARPGDWIIRASILAGALFAILAGRCIYGDLWSYGRVFFWVPVGIWLAATHQGWRGFLLLLTPACLWHLVAILGWV